MPCVRQWNNLSAANIFMHKERNAKFVYDDETVSLTNKEFDLLYKLLSYPGIVFTKQQLLDEIKAVGNGDMDVRLELKATKEEMQAFTNEFSHEFKTLITSS